MTVYQSDISVIPLDIIALKNCTLLQALTRLLPSSPSSSSDPLLMPRPYFCPHLQDNEHRFALYSSMTEKPWHFEAESPAVRAEWMTSLLFSMYPLPLQSSGLGVADIGNTTATGGSGGGSTSPTSTASTASVSATSGTVAVVSPKATAAPPSAVVGPVVGGGRSRGYTGVGLGTPPPYGGSVVIDQKEGYPSASAAAQREGKAAAGSGVRPSVAPGVGGSVSAAGVATVLLDKEKEIAALNAKLGEAVG
jgi:hypothetical protein